MRHNFHTWIGHQFMREKNPDLNHVEILWDVLEETFYAALQFLPSTKQDLGGKECNSEWKQML